MSIPAISFQMPASFSAASLNFSLQTEKGTAIEAMAKQLWKHAPHEYGEYCVSKKYIEDIAKKFFDENYEKYMPASDLYMTVCESHTSEGLCVRPIDHIVDMKDWATQLYNAKVTSLPCIVE